MPNWCSTAIKFYSENKEQLEEMNRKFIEIMDGKSTVKNDFKNGWIGDYANTFFPELGHDKINCRGRVDEIDDIEFNQPYFVFTMWTETAWTAKMGIWNEIVKKFYPDVHIAYVSEECGNDYFCVWDETEEKRFFPDIYYVDGCFPQKDGGCYYVDDKYGFGSIEEIHKFLDEHLLFGYLHTENLDALTNDIQNKLDDYSELNEYDETLYVQISEFYNCSPADFNFLEV